MPNSFPWFRPLRHYKQSRRISRASRRCLVETLGERTLFASDLSVLEASSTGATAFELGAMTVAEGEATADLVGFAKALTAAGVKLYGADWSLDTTQQTRLFDDGVPYLDFIEVTLGDRSRNATGIAEGITTFPTWKLQGGERLEGVKTLAELSTATGIAIPQSSTPSFRPIEAQTVFTSSPLHIPVDAYDPNGDPLTINVVSSNPSAVSATLLTGNQTARMVTDFGDMTFQLFSNEAPRAANRFIELAQNGFYNTQGSSEMTFHRVASGFVIQAGDPLGTGTGGSTLGRFDDQFSVNLQHNRSGVLSFAKGGDDTNDSQFFITDGPSRFLDYNHSVFGQILEGDAARQGIQRTATMANERPLNKVFIRSVDMIRDRENGLIRLQATGQAGAQANITVTVTDSEGNRSTQVFAVTVAADMIDSNPFLADIKDTQFAVGSPIQIQLVGQDVEGDPILYLAQLPPDPAVYIIENGLVGFGTSPTFAGEFELVVAVQKDSNAEVPQDVQSLRIQVGPALKLDFSRSAVVEGGATMTATVTRRFSDLSQPLTVDISASVPDQVTLQTSVTIPANQASVTFPIAAIDDTLTDKSQRLNVIVEALGFFSATQPLDVVDNEVANPWNNASNPVDANGDRLLSPIDVLVIINQLSLMGSGALNIPYGLPLLLVDTNNDRSISPIDVLVVINALNRRASSEGEGSSQLIEKTEPSPTNSTRDQALAAWVHEDVSLQKQRRSR